ncbi:MAG: YggT family protein [Spirochaetales bacterium]|nr:YggT family protein [Spirochaetales bacterium]
MTLLLVVNGIIMAYIIILSIRILMSWFMNEQVQSSREYGVLVKITEPYLSVFRRLGMLRFKQFDLSPVAGILFLQLVSYILLGIVSSTKLTLGHIIVFIIGGIWSIFSFLLVFLLILFVIKIIVLLTRANTASRFVITIDSLLHPVMGWINVKFFRRRILQYRNSLFICSSILIILLVGGNLLVGLIKSLLT